MLRIVAFDRAMAFDDAAQVAGHQHHVGALDGDVGAGADGDADIGLRERRRIVDAVADEGDCCRRLPQPLHGVDLAVGQNLGDHLVDAEPRGDRLGGAAVVAGDHRDLEAQRMQSARSPPASRA